MKKYNTLLFDSDNTLLDFDLAEEHALNITFSTFAPHIGSEIKDRYKVINKNLWAAYENGEIKREDIFSRRFTETFDNFNITLPDIDIAEFFQNKLSEGHALIPGAGELLASLFGKYDMHIVTNGKKTTQLRRLKESGIEKYFGQIFISEDLGCQKPVPQFFDIVFARLGVPRESALIIGDSFSSDIAGGFNAGIDTCWLNPAAQEKEGRQPTYIISSLSQLLEIL